MKNIEIHGKHHCDKINKANDPNNLAIVAERDCMQNMPIFVFENYYQVQMINNLYLNFDSDFEYKKLLIREIHKKITSYKSQDKNKNKYNHDNINQEQAIEKIVASKFKMLLLQL